MATEVTRAMKAPVTMECFLLKNLFLCLVTLLIVLSPCSFNVSVGPHRIRPRAVSSFLKLDIYNLQSRKPSNLCTSISTYLISSTYNHYASLSSHSRSLFFRGIHSLTPLPLCWFKDGIPRECRPPHGKLPLLSFIICRWQLTSFQLNTSMLGRAALSTSKSHSSLLNSIESSIKGDLNNLAADIAKDLHIHDFYSMHIMDYCEVRDPPTISHPHY